jgi:hypothetical protein
MERERAAGWGWGECRGSRIGFEDPFIRSERDLSHLFADEWSKMNGLYGSKRACHIPPLLNIFLFLFLFLCNMEIITIWSIFISYKIYKIPQKYISNIFVLL